MTICAVTNHDLREDMLQYADTNLTRLQGGNLKEHPNTNLIKLGCMEISERKQISHYQPKLGVSQYHILDSIEEFIK